MEIFHKSEHFQGNVKPIYKDNSKTYNETIKNAIGKKVSLKGANLSNLNFNGMCLTGVLFAHSKIDNSTFENCDLRDCDFSGVNFETANFNNADTRRLIIDEVHCKYENLMQ